MTAKLDSTILKYLKPEITSQPRHLQFMQEVCLYHFQRKASTSLINGKDGVDLAGETNATLAIIDANATLHDGNYLQW